MKPNELHPAVSEMLAWGRQAGAVTYDQITALFPDEYVDADRVDDFLVSLRLSGIELAPSHTVTPPPKAKPADFGAREGGETVPIPEEERIAAEEQARAENGDEEEDDEDREEGDDDSGEGEEMLTEEQAKEALRKALAESQHKRIDDPVRMYLTQMGGISLLTRAEELRLAKKIETMRMIFRRKLLENDYSISQMVDILELVHEGDLPFDRTMKISTAEEDAKGKIASRIPNNLKTVRHMLELNRQDWERIDEEELELDETAKLKHRMAARRRKMCTLIEELSLRTSKVQPMLKKLRSNLQEDARPPRHRRQVRGAPPPLRPRGHHGHAGGTRRPPLARAA